MALVWSDEYSTGEPEVDKQHQILFKYLADLEAHMESGIDARFVGNLFDNLGLYTRSHFCYEEICMRRFKCPLAAKNKEQHAKLLEAFTFYKEKFEREGISDELVQKVHDFLESWLVNHIMKIDTGLKSCIK